LNNAKNKLFNLIGIGTFLYLSISGFYIMVKDIIRDLLIVLKLGNHYIFWLSELVPLTLFSLTSYFTIRFLIISITQSKLKTEQTFLFFFIGFFATQILQFLYSYYGTDYILIHNSEKFGDYIDCITKDSFYGIASSLISLLKTLIFGIILLILKKIY